MCSGGKWQMIHDTVINGRFAATRERFGTSRVTGPKPTYVQWHRTKSDRYDTYVFLHTYNYMAVLMASTSFEGYKRTR